MMLQLSRKSLLALEAVLDVALHARPDPVQASALTSRLNVQQRYLEHIMQALVRNNILCGVRGPRGGYRLARERRRITLNDIIFAIDSIDDKHDTYEMSSKLGIRVIQPVCVALEKNIKKTMSKITIDTLCSKIEYRKIEKQNQKENHDFTI